MARKSLYNISLEDEDILSHVEGQETVEVDEVIAAEEELVEFQEESSDIQEDVEALEESQEVVEELQEQAEEGDRILEENPEAITENEVAVAQESLAIAMATLGFPRDHMYGYKVSRESAVNSPIEAFRISNEGIKEFAAKAVETIKALFAKIMNAIRKLQVKFITLMDRTAKQASGLADKIKEKSGNVTISEETKKKVFEKLPIIITATKGDIDKEILEFANQNYVEMIAKDIDPNNLAKASADYKFTMNSLSKKITEFVNSVSSGDSKVVGVCQAYKKSVTGLTAENDITTIEIPNDKLVAPAKLGGAVSSWTNMVYLLTDVKSAGSKTKAYADGIAKGQKTLEGIIANISKSNKDNEKDTADARKALRLIQTVGSKVALESIQQYVAINKTILSIINTIYSENDKGDAKSDKKDDKKADN